MDHHFSGCLPAEKFPTFAFGRRGRGATTLSDFRRQFHLTRSRDVAPEESPAYGDGSDTPRGRYWGATQQLWKAQRYGKLMRPKPLYEPKPASPKRARNFGRSCMVARLACAEATQSRASRIELCKSTESIQLWLAIRSASGKFCAPDEAEQCPWSGRTSHPMIFVLAH
jgi:hypothetical protein